MLEQPTLFRAATLRHGPKGPYYLKTRAKSEAEKACSTWIYGLSHRRISTQRMRDLKRLQRTFWLTATVGQLPRHLSHLTMFRVRSSIWKKDLRAASS